MEKEKKFNEQMNFLFSGMEKFISSETVVGEPIHIDNTIILPLVDVTFGVAAGPTDTKSSKGGGLGAKISPTAILVINDGHARLVSVKNKDSLSKVIDLVPDIMDRFVPIKK